MAMAKESRIYGLWESPITARSLASNLRLGEPCWDSDGKTLGWVEGRGDRGVIVVQDDEGNAPRDLTSDISVRAFVGYGGGDFTLSHGNAYFVGQADQRIYRQPIHGGRAKPITPAFGAASTPRVSPDGKWVAYVHTYEDVDCIAIVGSEGKRWPIRLGEGRDFYMQPAWSPDGGRIAWVEWDFPNMPWDGTELRCSTVIFADDRPRLGETETLAGGPETAIFQPEFSLDGAFLWYVSDETGWGHLYRRDLASGEVTRRTDGEIEFGMPAWQQGMRTFAVSPDGGVHAIRRERGWESLVTITGDEEPEEQVSFGEGYVSIASPAASPADGSLAVVMGASNLPARMIVMSNMKEGPDVSVRRYSSSEEAPRRALSVAKPVSWTSFDGESAHGIYFPPASARFESEGAPPLIVLVHGGPTSQVTMSWNAQAQYFATRGYAILLPNYRGSTGYGREYMLKLRGEWGLYDVQDAKSGAQSLVGQGLADGSRLVIMGGSAGGFTVLQSLVELPGFYKAAICMYGVANQFTLASDTHKFEQRYLDQMIGPLPEEAWKYRERSPIFHADKIRDAIAVFQGDIDRVVPREQSDSIVASLRARGVPHEYHIYEGEGHGWRKAETIEVFYGAVERFLREHVLFA
jgi:dipeptidyl aminopeptidase/acylaminoacyl peptidase